jgi:hypothetical protein
MKEKRRKSRHATPPLYLPYLLPPFSRGDHRHRDDQLHTGFVAGCVVATVQCLNSIAVTYAGAVAASPDQGLSSGLLLVGLKPGR